LKLPTDHPVPVLFCATLFAAFTGYCHNLETAGAAVHEGLHLLDTYQMPAKSKGTSIISKWISDLEGDKLEAMALDNYRSHVYVDDKATNQVQ
jgi:hypothetical protein